MMQNSRSPFPILELEHVVAPTRKEADARPGISSSESPREPFPSFLVLAVSSVGLSLSLAWSLSLLRAAV